jgi:hypothetical protein
MRRNSCTVIVLATPVPPEVLGAVDRSMNVTLVRPPESHDAASADSLTAAADALRRASRATSPYALAEQAAAVLTTLGSLRHGPWWPTLDDLLNTARAFYPGQLPESSLASRPVPT